MTPTDRDLLRERKRGQRLYIAVPGYIFPILLSNSFILQLLFIHDQKSKEDVIKKKLTMTSGCQCKFEKVV